MENKTVFALTDQDKAIIADDVKRVFDIKDINGEGIVIDFESVCNKIEKAANDIVNNAGKKTEILQAGNGKIDSSVLCQAIFPVISCPFHCAACYAVNACTKKFNGIGRQTAEAWYKWYFIEKYYPEIYFNQIDRELTKTKSIECRLHVSGDFIDNIDVEYWKKAIIKHSSIKFYTYTKRDAARDNMPSLPELMQLDNVNIVDSLPCGMKNYGDKEYLKKLEKAVSEKFNQKLIVCACGTDIEKAFNKEHSKKNGGDGKKYCGGCCKACRDYKFVGFIQHK